MAPSAKYKVGGRVKCLATRFDKPGNEDAQGRKWSQVHLLAEKTKWARGTVHKLLGGRRWGGNYKIKYDGDGGKQETSHESHSQAAPPIGGEHDDSDSGSSSGSSVSDDGDPAASGEGRPLLKATCRRRSEIPMQAWRGSCTTWAFGCTNGHKCPFGCKGCVTAVAAGKSQRFYSGVGIFSWHYLSSPPQIPRFPRVPLERGGLTLCA
jgi:hypothetical protein